ncbi:Gfo/Idh/MocA family oxidoreductase [Pedobacter duraquae]|uniref:Putative dehydrogenase n=1 Tax=Pedobacter duraquae TaxID=425511 RepID=A0A4R6IHW3_9SPHI|nr:Gfo/Idh/MocA family oxidoreductase [Pedobacter duraquae]TDO21465.1 putative dehydrogenase [Pedobacter duraquae]
MINTGLLAYGMSGKVFHAPFVSAHQGFNLVAVAERHTKQASTDYPGVISYDSPEALLDDENISLVVINTPNYTHYDYAKKALLKGKDILVEKPFTATVEEAEELFALAEKQNKTILFYQNRRWDSDFISVKEVLASNKLGKLNEVTIRYDRYRAVIGPKSFKEEPVPASGLLFDLAPHLLDQVISVFGEPSSYTKVLAKNRKKTQVDDYFQIHLQYENGLQIYVISNMLVAGTQPAFVIHGETGTFSKARADVQEEQLLKGIRPGMDSYGVEAPENAGLLTVVQEDGTMKSEKIIANPGNYLQLFDAVYNTLIHNAEYPVSTDQVLTQLRIITGL